MSVRFTCGVLALMVSPHARSWQSLNSSEQAELLIQRIRRVNYDGRQGDLTIELLPDHQENQS